MVRIYNASLIFIILISPDVRRCLDLYLGYETSSCPEPCETFHAQTKFVAEHVTNNDMVVRIKFSPKVICSMTFYICIYNSFTR